MRPRFWKAVEFGSKKVSSSRQAAPSECPCPSWMALSSDASCTRVFSRACLNLSAGSSSSHAMWISVLRTVWCSRMWKHAAGLRWRLVCARKSMFDSSGGEYEMADPSAKCTTRSGKNGASSSRLYMNTLACLRMTQRCWGASLPSQAVNRPAMAGSAAAPVGSSVSCEWSASAPSLWSTLAPAMAAAAAASPDRLDSSTDCSA
mmetsp:Transcript_27791/g.64088  ORF Transcript_27791/g.64088 Transcript_27791/m.64088 type:complete len:204 (+) Transcript_27791:1002-1613(+)